MPSLPSVFKYFSSSSLQMEDILLSAVYTVQKNIITSLQLPVYQQQKDMAGRSIYQKLPLRIIARKFVADLTSSIDRSLFLPAFNTYIKRMEKPYTSCDLKYNRRMEKPYESCHLKYNEKEQW